jgi:hypothetical protein
VEVAVLLIKQEEQAAQVVEVVVQQTPAVQQLLGKALRVVMGQRLLALVPAAVGVELAL